MMFQQVSFHNVLDEDFAFFYNLAFMFQVQSKQVREGEEEGDEKKVNK